MERDPHAARATPRRPRWGLRFFEQVVKRLPPSAPPAERRLLRAACQVHREIDWTLRGERLCDADLWMLAAAIHGFNAMADDAIGAGLDKRDVGRVVALTATAGYEVLEAAIEREPEVVDQMRRLLDVDSLPPE